MNDLVFVIPAFALGVIAGVIFSRNSMTKQNQELRDIVRRQKKYRARKSPFPGVEKAVKASQVKDVNDYVWNISPRSESGKDAVMGAYRKNPYKVPDGPYNPENAARRFRGTTKLVEDLYAPSIVNEE